MFDGVVNKKSGVLVINLPSIGCDYYDVTHDGEKAAVYPENTVWRFIDSRTEYERRYPHAPARIIDNLRKPEARVSVTTWHMIANDPGKLSFLIDATYNDRAICEYDLSRPMRRADS